MRVLKKGRTMTQIALQGAEMRNVVDLIAADGIVNPDCLQKFYLIL